MPEIPIKVTVENDDAKKKLEEIPKDLKKAEEETKGLTSAFKNLFKEATSGLKKVEGSFDKGFKKIGGSDKALDSLKGSFGGLKEVGMDALGNLDKSLGGLPSKFMGINTGTKIAGVGMKGFKVALASTGLGLIVIALGELVAVLMKSKTFTDAVSDAMNYLSNSVKNAIGFVADLGKVFVSLFTGTTYAQATQDLADATDKLSGSQKQLYKDLVRRREIEEELMLLDRSRVLINAKNRQSLALLNNELQNGQKSYEEKLDILAQIRDQELENIASREQQILLEKEDLAIAARLGKLTKEQKERTFELEAELVELQTERIQVTQELSEAQRDATTDENERIAEQKEKNRERIEEEKEAARDLADLKHELERERMTDLDRELDSARMQAKQRVEDAQGNAEVLKLIEENLAQELEEIRRDHAEKNGGKSPEVEAREQLAEELRLATLSQFDREKADLTDQMQERLKIAGDDAELRAQIQADYNKELKALEEQANADSMAAREEYFKLLRTDEQNELLELDKYFGELILLAQENGDSTVELERLYASQKDEIRDEYRRQDVEKQKAYTEEVAELMETMAASTFAIIGTLNETQERKQEEAANNEIRSINESHNRKAEQIKATVQDEEEMNRMLDNLEQEKEYQTQLVEHEREIQEHEAAKKSQKFAILQVLTDQAMAMASAIRGATAAGAATGPAAPFTTPGFIATAIAGVVGTFASVMGILNSAPAPSPPEPPTPPQFDNGDNAGGDPINFTDLLQPTTEQVTGNNGNNQPVQAYILQTELDDNAAIQALLAQRSQL